MTDDLEEIARLIEESSLGTAGAKSLRRRISPDAARAAVRAAHRDERGPAHQLLPTVVLIGVLGSGKSSLWAALAARTGWAFREGDDFHPQDSIAKMSAGLPLDDLDRFPWLSRISDWIDEQEAAGRGSIVACSVLKRQYRDILRKEHPSVFFVHLDPMKEALLGRRTHHGHSYIPHSLLESQLRTLEPLDDDEPGLTVHDGTPQVLADWVLEQLGTCEA